MTDVQVDNGFYDLLKEGERIDDLERNGYRIIQHKDKFCFGMDAVLLSFFANVNEGENVLDLGTGTGIILTNWVEGATTGTSSMAQHQHVNIVN
jgi:tRNA1Val (adenine37-N6)-methyltransferase